MNTTTLGIDLAKNIFQLHGVDKNGCVTFRKALSRSKFPAFTAQLSPCLIGIEACGGSHYWARMLRKQGHEVKIMAAKFIKPYIKSNKNDRNDAEAICEAVGRPSMRFVPQKTVYQQDIQSLHRIRHRLVRYRTSLCNQIRGLLGEYGIVLPRNIQNVRNRLLPIIEDEGNTDKLTIMARDFFQFLYKELVNIDKQIKEYDVWIERIFQSSEVCRRLSQVEGVGPLTATAFVSSCGEPEVFKNGRECSAWLGLVPRQKSSGGKSRLLGISKRGNSYLRCLLIHGARSVIRRAGKKKDCRSRWVCAVEARRGTNKAIVALANKNVRIMWSLLVSQGEYRRSSVFTSQKV